MPTAQAPRRRRLAPEVRKAEIADATALLITEKGYWGLTFDAVAKASGVTVQGVLHHFPTKDDLLLGVLDRRDRVDIESVVPDHPIRSIHDFLDVMSKLVARNEVRPELIRLYSVLAVESLSKNHPAHEYFANRYTRGVAAIADLAREWHDDPLAVGRQVHGALDGLQINWLRDESISLVSEWNLWSRNYFHRYLAEPIPA